MKNLTFHIVGLTHNDVKGHEVEYAKEAEGRTICLVPDDANTFDMLAVKAYDKQQLIGYVSALEGEDVRALIIARKERNLRTRCIGCNSKNEGDKAGLQLMVRALSDVSDEEMEQARREIYDDKIYDDWQYSGPVLPIEMGFITSSAYRERAAYSFFVEAPNAIKKKQTGTYDYKDQLDAIEQQLHAFPHNLYPTFKADPVDFLRQVFYKRVPRKKMLQLLSGIVLMIMNGRVDDVKQWGKHGDEESLIAMKTVGKKPAIGEHKKELMALVKKAVLKIAVYQKRGYYGVFLSKQAYWYPIFRLMGDWELLPPKSPQSFCTFLEELFEGKKISGPKARLCGRDDLRQAGIAPFSNHEALKWKDLEQEELINTQEAKFNRYCEIVDIFMKILGEEAFKKGIMLDDWLKE